MAEILSSQHQRNLAWLAAAALLSTLLAVLGVLNQASSLAPKYAPEPFFPGFASEVQKATRIRVVSRSGGSFDVALVRGSWVLPQRANYPASFQQVQRMLVGLAALETIEPKTSRPEWFHFINVDAPPKGNGVLVDVRDSGGHSLASAIFGTSEDIGDATGAVGLFARKPTDLQSWLLRSVIEIKGDAGEWMDKSVVAIDRARIEQVDVKPTSGPAFSVRRDKPSDADFKLAEVPQGREVTSDGAADAVASAISDFSFDDVRPAPQIDFAKASRLVTKTFDGLTVTASVVQLGQDYWGQLSATGDPARPNSVKEAQDLGARAGAWAYKLPAYKGQQFMTTLESLLKPSAATAKTDQ